MDQEVNPVEDRARELGWKPQEEFDGDEAKWVPADEFVRRQPLFEKIESEKRSRIAMEKQLAETNKALKELGEHNKKIAENAYKRALAELRNAKKEALREGEAVLAEEIQERIEELKPEPVPEVPQYNPNKARLDAWYADNKWYLDNTEMRNVADGLAQDAIAKGKSVEDVLEELPAKIKKLYPEEFGMQRRNPNKEEAPNVETRGAAAAGKKPAKYQPTEEEKKFARTFVAQGVFKNVEEYYQQLAEMGD
jgi:hypothetical protein